MADPQFNFNGTTPAAPAGTILAGFQQDGGTTVENISMTIPIATDAALGVVQPDGTTITVDAGEISVPTATGSALGLVKPDGATVLVTAGEISVAKATDSTLGAVMVDGSSITIDGTGKISATGGGGGGGGFGGGETAFTAPILSDFTELNFASGSTGTAAGTGTNGAVWLTHGGSGSDAIRALTVTISTPGSPWTATARFRLNEAFPLYLTEGIVIYDPASGKAQIFGLSNPEYVYGYINMASLNSWSSQHSLASTGANIQTACDVWMRLHYDGTNLNMFISRDGNFFWFIGSVSATAYLPTVASVVGFGMESNNSADDATATNPYHMQCFSWTLTQP